MTVMRHHHKGEGDEKDEDEDEGVRKKKDADVPSRNIFRGPTSALVTALDPLVLQTGFIKYHEKITKKTLMQKDLITKQARFLQALHQVFAPLNFRQKQMEAAISTIGKARGGSPAQPSVLSEWSEVTSRRLRCMCRHYTQAQGKARGSHCSWVHSILQASWMHALVLQIYIYICI